MGTHPIFESDFDCLTEKMARSVPPLKSDAELTQALLQEAMPMIRAGVNRLLADRPADAMAYLAEYFQSLVTTEPSSTMIMPKKCDNIFCKKNLFFIKKLEKRQNRQIWR